MGAEVVTIAMTTGAHAEQIGRLVAEQLKFRHVNDEIIDRAAEQAGVSRQAVAEVEQSPTLMTRIMNGLAAGMSAEWAGSTLNPEEIDPSASYRRLIQAVIREIAGQRKAVIVAHGASILLADTPGVLRVLVTASPATRAARLAAATGRDERAATREVQRADNERLAFFKRFYGLDEELETYYDVVINTDALSPDAAARLIAYAARDS
jgi:cytidylate kinase-like protein